MKVSEIRESYYKEVESAKATYEKRLSDFLKENKLDGKVRRVDDGKIGWIGVHNYYAFLFYPMKKNGEKSCNSAGRNYWDDVIKHFEPYKEEE